MSLKIPELQVMLPRASEISRTQQVQMQENVQRQQEFASQMASQTQQAESTVNHTPAGDRARFAINRKAKKRENEQRQAGKSADGENKENVSQANKKSDFMIDIVV